MSNTNKAHSKSNTSLSLRDGRIAVNMFCTVFVRIASVNPTRVILLRTWPTQTLLKILDYPHGCHVLGLRHSSRSLLKNIFRTTATYTSCHTSSTKEYMLRNILVPPLTSRLLAFVFTRSEISVENADFLLKQVELEKTNLKFVFYATFYVV